MLQPRLFELLCHLDDCQGRPLHIERIFTLMHGSRLEPPSESAIYNAIYRLRLALGNKAYIVSRPRVGYVLHTEIGG